MLEIYMAVETGLRFKPKQNELGWADFRLTQYQNIEKWWEIVCSAYSVSLFADSEINSEKLSPMFRVLELENIWKNIQNGMKELAGNWLNNLRLISLPFSVLISSLVKVFPIPHLSLGFPRY